jgi:hypothetical protein
LEARLIEVKMSTRGCIAIGTPRKWEGTYNHWDSYPTGLGKNVWDDIDSSGYFEYLKDLRADIKKMKDDENAGDLITKKNSDPLFIEWVYILNPKKKQIKILASRQGVGESPDPKRRESGVAHYVHFVAHTVDVEKGEPNWESIEQKVNMKGG